MSRELLYSEVATIKMSRAQVRLIEQRAKCCGVRPSVWMRSVLTQVAQAAARQTKRTSATGASDRRGYLRIREPEGATI